MATILAFAGSNSSTSVNFKLVKHTASLIQGHKVQLLNLANFPFPMYSADHERESGFSNSLVELKDDINKVEGIVLSVNEHNGGPSAYFKNLTDWLSRLDMKFLEGTKVFLMSASPGRGGGKNALEIVEKGLSRFGADVVATFSLPSFNHNFDLETGITDSELKELHAEAMNQFLAKI
ncbi:NADPH-dependent FMN reductase [Spongiimicrobium sp. 3-5]|uniref:NADPH-dependent FMN reductase n=1 Tax=Spongiimicrobium sp. 3-5 TaxID=3332596 RepID=UPI00398056F9